MDAQKPLIGISSCLLGEKVRYDGAHKYDDWINEQMANFFKFHSVCPEMLMGLGAPRPTMRVVRDPVDGELKLWSHEGDKDLTSLIQKTNVDIQKNLPEISGYIFMKKSPSCGVERVKIYRANGSSEDKMGKGFFADFMVQNYPLLPVIDSGRLFDPHERDNFLRRVMAYYRFHKLDGSIKSLQDFHARYKFLLLEYHQDRMRSLGKLAANSDNSDPSIVYDKYRNYFFETLATLPTIKNQINTFQHLMGFFKNNLSSDEKKLFMGLVQDFGKGILPYQVPLKMTHFFIEKYQHYYLLNHYYLDPYPKELMPKI